METYSNYINEELFRNVEDSYVMTQKHQSVRFKTTQELGTVNANKLYSTVKKEIPKKKFMKILTDLVTEHGIRERNNNIIDNFNCESGEDNPECLPKLPTPISLTTFLYCKTFLLDKINEKM